MYIMQEMMSVIVTNVSFQTEYQVHETFPMRSYTRAGRN